jgi:enoyl-CoA hydratase
MRSWRDRYQTIAIDPDEHEGSVLCVTLNRPANRNSVNDVMHSELSLVFRDVRRDRSVRAVVLTGAGGDFCVGGDTGPTRRFESASGLPPFQEAREIVRSLVDLEVPVVAGVQGAAFGLGATLATLADVCIAERSAVFSDEHTGRGVTAGNGPAAIWPLLIGLNRAKHLLLDGTELTAQQAADLGLINVVVADGEARAAALAQARRWAAMSPFALQSTKAVLNQHLRASIDRTLDLGLALEEQAFQAKRRS